MTSPYEPPQAEVQDPEGPPWLPTWAVILTALSVAMFVLILSVVPDFEQLFRGFGADLPWFTRMVVEWFHFFVLFPLIAFAACIVLYGDRLNRERTRQFWIRLIIASFVLSLISLISTWVAMYLPVFAMGSVV